MATIDAAKDALSTGTGGATPKMEALIEVMYITAHADEDFGPKEREHFIANVVGICNGKIKAEEVKGILLKLKGKSKEGRDVRLKSVAGRLPRKEDREHAYALSCNMAMADGIILDEEKELFAELAKALGLDDKQVEAIHEELKALEPEEE
jgi:tellurite resistance protein